MYLSEKINPLLKGSCPHKNSTNWVRQRTDARGRARVISRPLITKRQLEGRLDSGGASAGRTGGAVCLVTGARRRESGAARPRRISSGGKLGRRRVYGGARLYCRHGRARTSQGGRAWRGGRPAGRPPLCACSARADAGRPGGGGYVLSGYSNGVEFHVAADGEGPSPRGAVGRHGSCLEVLRTNLLSRFRTNGAVVCPRSVRKCT